MKKPPAAKYVDRASAATANGMEGMLPVVTLNLGGRNTNPLEFLLDGDDSEIGQDAIRARIQATEAMVDTASGPAAMPFEEREVVKKILDSMYGMEDRSFVEA